MKQTFIVKIDLGEKRQPNAQHIQAALMNYFSLTTYDWNRVLVDETTGMVIKRYRKLKSGKLSKSVTL